MPVKLQPGKQYWLNGWSVVYSHATLFKHVFLSEFGAVYVPRREFNKTAEYI